MTPEDWKFIVQVFGSFGVGAAAVGAVIYFLIKTFASSYLSEKAKNLATKEDIERITRTVEQVKSDLLARHTLRFAALDRRLQVHQDAFMHVTSLAAVFFPDKNYINKAMQQCRAWYAQNALFLEPEAKTALDSAFNAVQNQLFRLSNQGYELPEEQGQYQTVLNALNTITEAVGLPPLKGDLKNILPSGEDD